MCSLTGLLDVVKERPELGVFPCRWRDDKNRAVVFVPRTFRVGQRAQKYGCLPTSFAPANHPIQMIADREGIRLTVYL